VILQSKGPYQDVLEDVLKIFRVISEKDAFMKFYEKVQNLIQESGYKTNLKQSQVSRR
jgi:hypothetical protein